MAKLYFSYSTMNAGKSTLLLQASHNYGERGMKTMLFTAELDDRSSVGNISSRIGLTEKASTFNNKDNIHKLIKGKSLYLGGIKIPFHSGLQGHSDGDVILHAIIDAILGAIQKKDIGTYYPSNKNRFKNIRSPKMLIGLIRRIAPILGRANIRVKKVDFRSTVPVYDRDLFPYFGKPL